MKTVKKTAAGFLLIVTMLFLLSGCSIVRRVQYQFTGGVETWEMAAIESDVTPIVEEYYYNHIPEELHEAYREIYVHIMKNEDEGSFLSSVGVDDFWDAYYSVLADHPEIFWIGSSAQVEESGFTHTVVGYSFETIIPKEARSSMKEKLEAAADECIAQISEDATIYQKIKYVYEYLIRNVDYNTSSADSQNIQSALLYKSSVCAGYSKAFQYILNKMGIFCTYITGTIRDGGEHGWNMVRIDDRYYYVDVTWGDPVFANQMEQEDMGNVVNYNYLCCTQEELFKTHVPGDLIPLPECISDDLNYYKLNGYYYESFDYQTIYDALMNSVWNEEDYIVLKFSNQESFETARYEMFENGMLNDPGQYLMQINQVSSWNYRYHTDENFYLITIYWK